MAPGGRPRRVQAAPPPPPPTTLQHEQQEYLALFIDPMMGTPLPIYVGEDVENREHLVHLITVSVSLHAWRSQVAPRRFHHGINYPNGTRVVSDGYTHLIILTSSIPPLRFMVVLSHKIIAVFLTFLVSVLA